MTCSLIAELGDDYTLGALPPDRRREVERHLDRCPLCRDALDSEQHLAAHLALAVPSIGPPAALRRRLVAAARGEPATLIARWRRLLPAPPARAALGAGSLASVAFIATLAWALTLQAQLTARGAPVPVAVSQAAATGWGEESYLARADMKRLVGSDQVPDARGWIYVDPATDSALLVAYKLPPLAADRAYQLWLVQGGQRTSGGTFNVDAEGYGWLKVRAPRPLGTYDRVGITVEPRSGSAGPTGARVMGGDL